MRKNIEFYSAAYLVLIVVVTRLFFFIILLGVNFINYTRIRFSKEFFIILKNKFLKLYKIFLNEIAKNQHVEFFTPIFLF